MPIIDSDNIWEIRDGEYNKLYPEVLTSGLKRAHYDFDTEGCWYLDSEAPVDKQLILFKRESISVPLKQIESSDGCNTKPYNYFNSDYIPFPLEPGKSYEFLDPEMEGCSIKITGFTKAELIKARDLAWILRFDSGGQLSWTESYEQAAKAMIQNKHLKEVISAG